MIGLSGGVFELDSGGEQPAAFTDRFEVAVELSRPCAPSVGQHPAMLDADVAHGWTFGISVESTLAVTTWYSAATVRLAIRAYRAVICRV